MLELAKRNGSYRNGSKGRTPRSYNKLEKFKPNITKLWWDIDRAALKVVKEELQRILEELKYTMKRHDVYNSSLRKEAFIH